MMIDGRREPKLRTTDEPMSWVLEPLMDIPHVRHGVVLASDGLVQGRSTNLPRVDAEGASAMLAGIISSSRGLLGAFAGSDGPEDVRQVVVEGHHGYVFLTGAGRNAVIAVYTDTGVDLGVVAHEVQVQVKKLGRAMSTPARQHGSGAVGAVS
ncbi:roadblock/LC7 domain-containing protein [Streptomyces sp. NPDC006638]|uniref:roadblock/LC7 domain-containing protein n=1 Tax=Streptomyces sp. NPDC006638 TaxID=3157183 RepID=UPI0033AC556C